MTHEYDAAYIRASFHALLLMQRTRLSPPLSVGWRIGDPPTLTVQVQPDEFADWYKLLDAPVSKTEQHESLLHISAEGTFPGCDCQLVRVVTVQTSPLACEITPDGWCTVHSSTNGPAYCKAQR